MCETNAAKRRPTAPFVRVSTHPTTIGPALSSPYLWTGATGHIGEGGGIRGGHRKRARVLDDLGKLITTEEALAESRLGRVLASLPAKPSPSVCAEWEVPFAGCGRYPDTDGGRAPVVAGGAFGGAQPSPLASLGLTDTHLPRGRHREDGAAIPDPGGSLTVYCRPFRRGRKVGRIFKKQTRLRSQLASRIVDSLSAT